MPADGFPFTIFISRDPKIICFFERFLQFFDDRHFFFGNFVLHLEIVIDIDRNLGARQIAHVAHARLDVVIFSQKTFDRFCFGRTFDNNKMFGHCAAA